MSDYLGLGALLGMSPPFGLSIGFDGRPRCACCGAFLPSDQQWAAAQASAYAQAVVWVPPPPEPGITWQPTGGKTWRVTITRKSSTT